MSTTYICLDPTGLPSISSIAVIPGCPSCQCQVTTNPTGDYKYYKNIYVDKLNAQNAALNNQYFREKVLRYSGFHATAAYGNPSVSKRLLGPICPAIYNFRKTF